MIDRIGALLIGVGMPRGSLARRGFLISVIAETVVVLFSIVNYATVDGAFFNLNSDYMFASSVGALVFAASAVASYLAARTDDAERPFWFMISGLAAILALETLISVHSRLEELGYYYFLVGYVVIGLAAAAAAISAGRWIAPPAPRLLVLAIASFVGAQAVALLNSVGGDLPAIENAVLTILEEWGEMLMASFVLAAALSVLDRRIVDRRPAPSAGESPGPRRAGPLPR